MLMPDAAYITTNLVLKSRGVVARTADDAPPPGESYWLQQSNLEELQENALVTRLGSSILSKVGTTAYPIGQNYAPFFIPPTVTTQGPASPSWSNPGDITNPAPPTTGVTVEVGLGSSPSQQILAAGQTPNIPSGATIAGFSVSLVASKTIIGAAALNISLAVSGTAVGTPKTYSFPSPFTPLGSMSDLWGYAGWTVTNVNADLGILIQASSSSATPVSISAYGLVLTIYYTVASTPGPVHSLSKLIGLNGNEWRYASVGRMLCRLSGLNPGIYNVISTSLSGDPWTAASFQPLNFNQPYIYFADYGGLLKDNGALSAPQKMGIFQPEYPISAQAQVCYEIILDPFTSSSGSYTTSNVGSFAADQQVVATTLSGAIVAVGLQAVSVAATPNPITLFQSLVIDTAGNAETVLVLEVTATGFVAFFTKTHLSGVAIVEQGVTGTVAASTTATISFAFSGTPISAWPTTLEETDYIGLSLYIGDPNAIQSITLQFNTANGAYFYRTIGQGAAQAALNAATDSTTAAADAIISDSLDVYTDAAGGVTQLNTVPGWTSFLQQLEDFSGAGGASFSDPVMNWSNVTSYQVTIVTGTGIATTSFPITIKLGSLVLFGGAGPDSFAGVGYDYLFTYFNINDYAESNPSMTMSNVNPPSLTNWVLPRRQPVLLTITNSNQDPQATYIRIYRRGGTLGDNYRRIDQVPLTAAFGATQTYTDIWADYQIEQADEISFTNDVPVTSSLPVPVNTILSGAIGTSGNPVNAVVSIPVENALNISVHQQLDIGNVASPNFETVIVQTVPNPLGGGGSVTAFVQNYHAAGEPVAATASYGQPLNIIALAFGQGWFAGDKNNPNNLYWSAKGNIQAVSSDAYEPVSSPGDGITAIVGTAGNLFVSTVQRWWSVAPGSNQDSAPTIYPTNVDHGCVGMRAWTLRDGVIYYLALDGIRTFMGGGGQYISEIIEFVWQNTEPTAIPIADPTQFSSVQVSWNNRWCFFSYQALDGNRYRVVLDVDNKRYRTDSLYAESMFQEEDSNDLVWGDNQSLVHLDRQLVAYDETNVAGVVTQSPIAFTLQTPYNNMGTPAETKQFQEFTGDFNTNGNPVTVELLFDDGETTEVIGEITTNERQRINLNLNNGLGYTGYKVSLQITGSGTEQILLYQAALRSIVLAKTRQSLDTYWLRFSDDGSKIAKNLFIEYTASSAITGSIYYDGGSSIGFPFTLPENGGVRNAVRVRLPAVSFRLIRLVLTSVSGDDFQVWTESRWEVKSICQGKGYAFFPLINVES